jgi:hypothetical protein
VGYVVANVPKDASAEDGCGSIPVVGEDSVCKLIKWCR